MLQRTLSSDTHFAPDDSDAGMPLGFFPLRLVLNSLGTTVELDRPNMLLGRHSDADICLPTPDVSRRHCRFIFTEGEWEVFDLNSLNGLFVNGERVQQMVLHHRDLVAVGSYRLQVDLGHDPDALSRETGSENSERMLESIAQALPLSKVGRRAS